MIKVRDLKVRKQQKTICHMAELDVAVGERATIVGANGCGKSTLLRVLGGLETEFTGQCTVATPMRERCYVHQSPYLFRGSVLSNATYGLRARGFGKMEAVRLASEILDRLGLLALNNQSSLHLSGGERRRVAIARALVLKPRLLLLDEPFADLDRDGSLALVAELERLEQSSDCSILISSPIDSGEHSGRILHWQSD